MNKSILESRAMIVARLRQEGNLSIASFIDAQADYIEMLENKIKDGEDIRAQRDHYLAGCFCEWKYWCVPHGHDGMFHRVCGDHEHMEIISSGLKIG